MSGGIAMNAGQNRIKKNLPPANDNLISNDQQLKEKIPTNTENNDNLSNDNASDLDNNSGNTGLEPKKQEIKFTPCYTAGEPIFLRVFEELSKDGNGLVDHYKLHGRLLSTGQFFVGEAALMIEHMEKIGKIEKTGNYNIYRIKD
jgi:hypothetical protein